MAQSHKPTANRIVPKERSSNGADASNPGATEASGLNLDGLDSTVCYVLQDEALIEDFENGSLVLLGEQLRFVQINPVARDVVALLDAQRTVRQVGAAIADNYNRPLAPVFADVLELLTYLESQGVVRRSTAQRDGAQSNDPSTT